jgi:cytoskeletal protein CcmA (bactofilin family)
VEGTITAQNDIRIDGSVEGILKCAGKLIIGPDGRVDGEATCTHAVIEGRFEGTLNVTEVLDVRENANVAGDIKTGKLLVQTGAIFNGNCDMGKKVKNMQQEQPNINEASAS